MSEKIKYPDKSIINKLDRLKLALKGTLFVEGIFWLVASVVAAVFFTLALDYLLRLGRPERMIVMAVALLAVGYIAFKQIIMPQTVPMDQENLALLVENHYGQLSDRLISAIQFGRRASDDSAGAMNISSVMIDRLASQASETASKLRFRDVLDRSTMKRSALIALAGVILLVGFSAWRMDIVSLWFQRNVLFASTAWPQDTYLSVRGGPDFQVVRGDDLSIEIVALDNSAVVPHHVIMHAKFPSVGSWTEEKLDLAIPGGRIFLKKFQAVSEPFEFYVTGGDDSRDKRTKHRVSIIDPPELIEVNFTAEFPGYMKRRPANMSGGKGVLPLPLGTWVSVSGIANKNLKSAKIILDGKGTGNEMRISNTQIPGGGVGPRAVQGRFNITGKNKPAVMNLKFNLTDSDGYTNSKAQQYMVQVQPDMAPVVEIRKKGVSLFGAVITPKGMLPLVVSSRDDWGLCYVQTLMGKGKNAPESVGDAIPAKGPRGDDAPRSFKSYPTVDLQEIGLDPEKTDTITIRVDAVDTLPAEFEGPNTGSSGTLTYRIITAMDLKSLLISKQKEIRHEFFQAMGLQFTSNEKVLSAGREQTPDKDVQTDVRRRLSEAQAIQVNVRTEMTKARHMFQAVKDEIVHNRIDAAKNLTRLNEILQGIGGLDEEMSSVAGQLEKTTATDDAEELLQKIDTIANDQADIYAMMEKIHDLMEKYTSRMEFVQQIDMLIERAEERRRLIEKYGKTGAESIFDDATSKPAEKPKGK